MQKPDIDYHISTTIPRWHLRELNHKATWNDTTSQWVTESHTWGDVPLWIQQEHLLKLRMCLSSLPVDAVRPLRIEITEPELYSDAACTDEDICRLITAVRVFEGDRERGP